MNKKYTFILFFILLLFTYCGNKVEKTSDLSVIPLTTSANKIKDKYIEVLFFYSAYRCVNCRAIAEHTKEFMFNTYSKEMKDGSVVYKIIDISDKKNEKIADKYEVTYSSLFINKWENGEEQINNMTLFAFANAKDNPSVFKDGLKRKIEELQN